MIAWEKVLAPVSFERETPSKVKIPWPEIDKWIESLSLKGEDEAPRIESAEAGDRRN